ncbi:MAG: hypothetical protein IIY40_00295 [Firmicutes bacterium]|nr:hypothetical protein [Bacillota bacterium]
MKHILLALIIIVLAVAFSACSVPVNTPPGKDAAEAPPELELYINEEEPFVFLKPGTYEWHIDNGDGTVTGINADAAHPLDVLDELAVVDTTKCVAVEIILDDGMEVTAVNRWDAAAADYDGQQEVDGEVVAADKTVYRLPVEAGWVYDIHVDFGDRGDSFYAFAAK